MTYETRSINSTWKLERVFLQSEIVGPVRPKFVLFGSSIVQDSFSNEGWGAILATLYARKVLLFFPLRTLGCQ